MEQTMGQIRHLCEGFILMAIAIQRDLKALTVCRSECLATPVSHDKSQTVQKKIHGALCATTSNKFSPVTTHYSEILTGNHVSRFGIYATDRDQTRL